MTYSEKKSYIWREKLNVLTLEREGKLLLREKKWDKAERIFSRLLDCDDVFWVYIGIALVGQKKYKSAKECFEKVLIRAGSGVEWAYDLFKNLGTCYYYLGDTESALENFNKAGSLRPNTDDDELLIGYGMVLKDQKKYQEAKKKFQTVLEKDVTCSDAWAHLAEIRAYLGDFEMAFCNLQQALDFDPVNEAALKVRIRWASHFQMALGSKPLFYFQM